MKKFLALMVFFSAVIMSPVYSSPGHDHKPLHGGKVFEAKEFDVELVVKSDSIELYVRDHGKPVSLGGGVANLSILNGAEKKDFELKPEANKFKISGSFDMRKGTRVVAIIRLSGKVVTARYVID
jgi:hypothetical protein